MIRNVGAPVCPNCKRSNTLITPRSAFLIYKKKIPYRTTRTGLEKCEPGGDFRNTVADLPADKMACVSCFTIKTNPLSGSENHA